MCKRSLAASIDLSLWTDGCNFHNTSTIITMLHTDRPICKESHVVLPSPERNIRVILRKKVAIPRKKITAHFRYRY